MRLALVLWLGVLGILLVIVLMPCWDCTSAMPQPGEVWCGRPDGDPWHPRVLRLYVQEIRADWVRYTISTPTGWEQTTKLRTFRAIYHPCAPASP